MLMRLFVRDVEVNLGSASAPGVVRKLTQTHPSVQSAD